MKILAFVLLIYACSHEALPEPEVALPPSPPVPDQSDKSYEKALNALAKLTKEQPIYGQLTEGYRWLLIAEAFKVDKQPLQARQAYLQALQLNPSSLAGDILRAWHETFSDQSQEDQSPGMLAKSIVDWQSKHGVIPVVASWGNQLETKLARQLGIETETVQAANYAGEDPLYEQRAKVFCKSAAVPPDLTKWVASLDEIGKHYFEGLIAACKKTPQKAMSHFQIALPKLAIDKGRLHFALKAAEELTVLYRRNGRREQAANAYFTLMRILNNPAFSVEKYGEPSHKFILRHINQALWAARYRAYVGDYLNATGFVHEAFEVITEAAKNPEVRLTAYRRELATYKAEGYHILAHRIAVEQSNFDRAIDLAGIALSISDLPDDWRDRFLWYQGLYHYINGNLKESVTLWSRLLDFARGGDLEPRLLFWLARTNTILGFNDLGRQHYLRLLTEYPLDFYTVVAPSYLGQSFSDIGWQRSFINSATLKSKFSEKLSVSDYRRKGETGETLLRAELVAMTGSNPWSQAIVRDSSRLLRRRYHLRNDRELFLYISRLQYELNDFPAAMALSRDLSIANPSFWNEHPEQLLVYYPVAYPLAFQEQAAASQIEQELMLAIARQESGFRPQVESFAGAIGLMQLIPPTARRFEQDRDLGELELRTALKDPEYNIMLGAKYLRFLRKKFKGRQESTIGAYNAGEDVLTIWTDRRFHSDPVIFVELFSFGETKTYTKKVMRNLYIYRFLQEGPAQTAGPGSQRHLLATRQ